MSDLHNERGEARPVQSFESAEEPEFHVLDLVAIVAGRWRLLTLAPLAIGVAALGATYLIAPTFTAKTLFVPPQQQQNSAAASALASLGALAGLAGGGAVKSSGDQYVALLQSANVTDKLIDRFDLMTEYKSEYRFQARETLARNSRIQLGKKDGLISIEVDAKSPKVAADIANQYVAELRRLSSELTLTEAQQRRAFFEGELKATQGRLATAQAKLESGGFSPGALKAEPKAAAESYARVKAEVTAAEVRLQTLRQSRSDNAPEVQQQLAMVSALRGQLSRLESQASPRDDADYLGRYREFKYQETLYELFSKQYELARMDESRDGVSIQVVDPATPPERKSKPKRAYIALGATFGGLAVMLGWVLVSHAWRRSRRSPAQEARIERVRSAWRGQN